MLRREQRREQLGRRFLLVPVLVLLLVFLGGGLLGRLGALPIGQLRYGLFLLVVDRFAGVVDGDLRGVPGEGPEFFFFVGGLEWGRGEEGFGGVEEDKRCMSFEAEKRRGGNRGKKRTKIQ